ncbi:MarR family winged helix-turn-helix transcriptional regulator [Methanobrevibacter sp.]|uniref:MarR family winged helix-turn-helix transcriptional regulator n=1 Tax=Methanobrevibacter sp. TaxID=66852 RepID=UPI00388D9494
MTSENNEPDKFDSMPFIALIHHISRNKLKYTMKNPNQIDMVHEGLYLMEINKRKNLSQDDLANMFGQSKGTIAKALKKLEDKEYVERKIDENNRRKYILKTTKKGKDLAILLTKDLEEWERNVGIDKLDEETKNQLRQIARKSEELLNDNEEIQYGK